MYKAQYSRSASYARYLEGELKALREYMNENYKGEYVATIEDVGGFPKIRVRLKFFHILATRFSMAQWRIVHFYQLTETQKEINKDGYLDYYKVADSYDCTNNEELVKLLKTIDYVLYH